MQLLQRLAEAGVQIEPTWDEGKFVRAEFNFPPGSGRDIGIRALKTIEDEIPCLISEWLVPPLGPVHRKPFCPTWIRLSRRKDGIKGAWLERGNLRTKVFLRDGRRTPRRP